MTVKTYSVSFITTALDANPVKHLGTVELADGATDAQILEAVKAAGMISRDNEGLEIGEWNGNLEILTGSRVAFVLSPVAPLRGTPAAVRYAAAVRDAWITSQVERAALEAAYSRGERAGDLVGATAADLEVFGAIARRRLESLAAMLHNRDTAAQWLESAERSWFDLTRRRAA